MPNNAFRGVVNGVGAGLICWGLLASFWISWYGLLIIAGALLLVVAGLADWIHREDHYDTTVYGDHVNVYQFPERCPIVTETTYTPLIAFTVIEGGQKPAWRDEL